MIADDDGNIGGSLRGDVKARHVVGQIVVEVPANPDVTKFECSGDATAHSYELLLVHPDNKYGNYNRNSNYS